MRNSVVPAIIVLLAAACDQIATEPQVAFQAQIAPVGASGVGGSAAALSGAGPSTEAGIDVVGAPFTTYGWEVRTGSCAAPGTILGGRPSFPDVTTDRSGVGKVERTFFSARMRRDNAYHAVIVQADDRATVLGCGDFVQF